MMNKIFTILVTMAFGLFLTENTFAQSPEKMNYQVVVRDADNNLAANRAIGVQISILQDSENGTAVYIERHFPTTNSNGLVSIEIGTGTVVSGDFTAIDWTDGPYFLKTETDLNGGANYTIAGTNQLLSVPYALHATTAETLSGDSPETDPVYSSSQAANITSTDITNLSNLSGTNTGDQDLSGLATKTALGDSIAQVRSEIPDISGIAENEQAIQDTASQIRADIPYMKTYSVGDFAQGGVVFYVDETGQHGLACAIEHPCTAIQWYNGSNIFTEAFGDGICAGEMNTVFIIAKQGSSTDDYAAGVCANYTYEQNGIKYGDWYLPSLYELYLMYQKKNTIASVSQANGGSAFFVDYYWSSSEHKTEVDRAYTRSFSDGYSYSTYKYNTIRVRAIRAF